MHRIKKEKKGEERLSEQTRQRVEDKEWVNEREVEVLSIRIPLMLFWRINLLMPKSSSQQLSWKYLYPLFWCKE